MNAPFSAIDVMRDRHREIERLFARLSAYGSNLSEVLTNLGQDILRYIAMVENHLYPAVRQYGGDAGRLYVEEGVDDHQVIRGLLARVQAEPPGSERWIELASELEQDVRHHFEEEESDLVPLAMQCLDRELLVQKGDAMLKETPAS